MLETRKEAFALQQGKFIYVFVLGTAPEVQGQGLGTAMLNAVTAEADEQNLCCYIETGNQRARALYERHGFVMHETLETTPDLPMYLLVRWPVSQSHQPKTA